jgi:DNA-binding LacI/PurR family transcriptional regulator
LTTIQIPYREIGYQAARRLHDLLESRFSATQHVYLNGKVLAGNSDARIAVEA